MSHVYYRGDGRSLAELQKVGFQVKDKRYRGRSTTDAIAYIKKLIANNKEYKNPIDFGGYIIRSSKMDSVSASCVLEGATASNVFNITCPGEPLYFEFKTDGSVGAQLADRGSMYLGKPYYILTNSNIALSKYVIVGTKTHAQEATFFTDIPFDWISLNN